VITNPKPLTAAAVLVLCFAAFVVIGIVLVARRRRVSFPALVAVALLATVAVTAPFTAVAVARDIRAAHDYTPFRSERVGPEDNGLDTTVVDRIGRRIPRDATYAIVIGRSVPQNVATVFRVWALTLLLPRVAVDNPHRAGWIVSLGSSPNSLGVPARGVEPVPWSHGRTLTAWVGLVHR
jgi:hypothetical protein